MMSSLKSNDIRRLCPWEEATGKLEGIEEEDGTYIAIVGRNRIAIPSDLNQRLGSYLGSRISILRTTEPPGEEFLFRVLDSGTNPEIKNSLKGDRDNGRVR